jgi:hypothetical protein
VIKIRYNTKAVGDDPLKWRVLEGDIEFLAEHVVILCGSYTSTDILSTGETKHHISCNGRLVWSGRTAIVLEDSK